VCCATGVGVSSSVAVALGLGNFIVHGRARARAFLVDLEGVDAPVGTLESRGVVLDVRVAGTSVGGAGAAGPDIAGPGAAEGDVEDDLEVTKVRADVAVSGETGGGGTPARRIGATAADVGGDACIGEVPDVNSIAGPLCRIDTAISIVKSVPVGRFVRVDDSAAGVGGLARSLDVAVASVEGTGEAGVGDRATVTGVQGHLVGGTLVDALDDIDFAIVGPVGAEHPECGPGAAGASGHVSQIQDHQTLSVAVLAGQTEAVATVTAGDIAVVYTHVDGATGGTNQTVGRGGGAIDIVHVAIGGVGFRVKVEHIEKRRVGAIVIHQSVSCDAKLGEKTQSRKECRSVHGCRDFYKIPIEGLKIGLSKTGLAI